MSGLYTKEKWALNELKGIMTIIKSSQGSFMDTVLYVFSLIVFEP